MEVKEVKVVVNNINKEILQDQVQMKSIDDFNYIFFCYFSYIEQLIIHFLLKREDY
jgi:hypothetical protein